MWIFYPNSGVLATSDRFHCGSRSNFGWNPHQRSIAVCGENSSCSGSQKHNTFDFCTIQFSQNYCLYLAIDVFTEMYRIQKEGKSHTKLIRSFRNVTERSNTRCNYCFLVILEKIFVYLGIRWLNNWKFVTFLCLTIGYNRTRYNSVIQSYQTFASGLILTSPTILGLPSILNYSWFLISPSLSLFPLILWTWFSVLLMNGLCALLI